MCVWYHQCVRWRAEAGGEFEGGAAEVFAVGPEMESCFEKTSKLGPQMANSRIRLQPSADQALQTGRGEATDS